MADSITLKSVQNNGSVTLVANNQTILLQGKAQGIQGIQGDPATNLVTSVAGRQGVVVLTKTDVGLSNVENTSDADKPISTATQTALNAKATTAALTSHTSDTSNPHATTAAQVGLPLVQNTSDLAKPSVIVKPTNGSLIPKRMGMTLISDKFLRGAGILSSMPSDSGSFYRLGTGILVNENFQAVRDSNTARTYVVATCFEPETISTLKFITGATQHDVGITLGLESDPSFNGLYTTIRGNSLRIVRLLNDVASDRATVSYTLPNNTYAEMTVVETLTTVSVYMNSELKISYTKVADDITALGLSTDKGITIHRTNDDYSKIIEFRVEALKPLTAKRFGRSVAHRGRVGNAPENSIVSLLELPYGVDGVEIDTQVTSDGHIVLMHDATVNRTTNGTGTVASMTLEQIKRLRIKDNGGQIPTLAEYLEAVATRPDIKEVWVDYGLGSIPDTVNICKASAVSAKCYLFVGTISQAAAVRTADATIKIILGSTTSANYVANISAAGTYTIDTLLMSPTQSAATDTTTISAIVAANVKVGLSLTTERSTWCTAAKAVGLDTILTDFAHLANAGTSWDETLSVPTVVKSALATKADLFPLVPFGVPYNDSGSTAIPNSSVRMSQNTALADSVVRRTSTGAIFTGTPTTGGHATDKTYVDARTPYYGTGFPNGVVTAPPGSIYIDTAITNGASSWIKKSGTGNTGWKILEGDTGQRDITANLVNGWTATKIFVRRVNNEVYLQVEGLNAAAMTNTIFTTLSSGFRGYSNSYVSRMMLHTSVGPVAAWRVNIEATGGTYVGNSTTATPVLYGLAPFPTLDDWPSTLPGVSA